MRSCRTTRGETEAMARIPNPGLFVSAKCACPIPARHPALRGALVAASLDPGVRQISHVSSASVGGKTVAVDFVMIGRRDEGIFVLDVVPARPDRLSDYVAFVRMALHHLGHTALVVTAGDLAAEPARSNRD